MRTWTNQETATIPSRFFFFYKETDFRFYFLIFVLMFFSFCWRRRSVRCRRDRAHATNSLMAICFPIAMILYSDFEASIKNKKKGK